ncbi:DUF916 and DUF3324 domain-containing protein [Enterococcus faecalis]
MKLSQVPNKTTGNGIKIFGYLCFVVSCYLIFLRFEVSLAQQPEPQPLAGFTVESVIPDNQLDKNQTYFYLGVQPSSQQIIQVKIRSLQKEPVTVALSIHDAVNGTDGQIDYTQTSPKLDSSLTNSITQIVHLQNKEATVTLKNFEEKKVNYEIKTPKEPFSGVKLGALRFIKQLEDESLTSNQFTSMLTEDKQPFDEGAELQLKKVSTTISAGQPVVQVTYQNQQPKVMKGATITNWLTKKGQTKELLKKVQADVTVAPNSLLAMDLPLNEVVLPAGTYTIHSQVSAGNREWQWRKDFTITQTQIKQWSTSTPSAKRQPFLLVGSSAIVLVVISIYFYLKKSRTK